MDTPTTRVSPADIMFPSSSPPAVPPHGVLPTTHGTIDGIRAMLDSCDTKDRNSLLTIAIMALIEAGVTTGPQIVGAARALGFNPRHAGAMLGKGRDWQRSEGGEYRLIAD